MPIPREIEPFKRRRRNVEIVADEELSAQNEDKINWLLEIKTDKTAVLTSVQGKNKEVRSDAWSRSGAQKQLTVKFSARKKNQMSFTYVFNRSGEYLVLAKMLTGEGESETSGEKLFKKI